MSFWSIIAGLALLSNAAIAQPSPDYREAVRQAVRASIKNPDRISFGWGSAPSTGWAAMQGKPKAIGSLGCVEVLGKNIGGDRIFLVYVVEPASEKVSGQIFTLQQLNKSLNRHMGVWFSHDPGCPSGSR